MDITSSSTFLTSQHNHTTHVNVQSSLSSMNDEPISIENYDVLMELPTNGTNYGLYQLEKYQDHVGNRRLHVFVEIHQQSYDDARQRNDTSEQSAIVEKIISTVCQQCVPPGRFLWNAKIVNIPVGGAGGDHTGQQQFSTSAAATTITTAPSSTFSEGGSFAPPPAASAGTVPVWQVMQSDQILAFVHAILQQRQSMQQQPKKQPLSDHQTSLEKQNMETRNGTSNFLSTTCSSPRGLSPKQQSPHRNDDDQKRRRRSSLLRRSASESMLEDSKKKLFRMGKGDGSDRRQVNEEPTWSSSRATNKNGLILSLNRMDLILTSSRNALDPNSQSLGNNRLHLLVAMLSARYQQASFDGREAVLDEVIETVNTFWGGRFLTESDDGYELIDKDDARNALRSIFEMRASQNLFSRGRDNDDATIVVPDLNLAPDSPEASSSGSIVSSGPGLISRTPRTGLLHQSSTGMIPQPPTMVARQANAALARQVSASVLPSEPILNGEDVGNLRSAAVRSLQRQRERQRVASRLQMGSHSARNNDHVGVSSPTFMDLDLLSESSLSNNPSTPSASFVSSARRRQSTIFGELDLSLMDELTAELDDD